MKKIPSPFVIQCCCVLRSFYLIGKRPQHILPADGINQSLIKSVSFFVVTGALTPLGESVLVFFFDGLI